MLAFNYFTHHVEGGSLFMFPLTILFIFNLGLFVYLLIRNDQTNKMLKLFRQVGLLIMAYGMFGTLVGFLQMFEALESIKDSLPLQVISGGVKVALLNVAYGTAYFFIIQLLYMYLTIRTK